MVYILSTALQWRVRVCFGYNCTWINKSKLAPDQCREQDQLWTNTLYNWRKADQTAEDGFFDLVQRRLNFSEPVNSVCKKASQRIALLMRLRNLIVIKAKLHNYTTCVQLSDSRKLKRLQERGLRVVYNEKEASYFQLLEKAKMPI